MAARGRTRGAAPGAPRPKIEPRKQPFTRRPAFKRTAAVVGGLLVLIIVLSVCGRVGRANDLRAYDRSLAAALRPFTKHIEAGAPTNVADVLTRAQQDQIPARELEQTATTWQTDFVAARDAVRKLDPPDELTYAQETLGQSLDNYEGVADLILTWAKLDRAVGDLRRADRADLQEHVSALQAQVDEARTRADVLRTAAMAEVKALKDDWGVAEAA